MDLDRWMNTHAVETQPQLRVCLENRWSKYVFVNGYRHEAVTHTAPYIMQPIG